MVVLKNFISTQFTNLETIQGRVLYDTTLNVLRYNDSVTYNNLLVSKDTSNNLSNINNFDLDNNLTIAGHNGTDTGLILNNTLVTSTGTQLNYTNVTQGVGMASKALVLDSDRNIENINILSVSTLIADNLDLTTAVIEALNTTGNVGINTTARLFGLEVNHSTGDCLRLTYNDDNGSPTARCDLQMSPTGSLVISPTGNNPSVLIGGNISGRALSLTKQNVANNTVDLILSLTGLPDSTPATGLGVGMEFSSLNSTYTLFTLGTMETFSTNVTDGSETGEYIWKLAKTGILTEVARLTATGSLTCNSVNVQSIQTDVISSIHIIETSDIRLKRDIEDIRIDESVSAILDLKPKKYKFINETKESSGFIAQEVKEVLPSVVDISQGKGFDDLHQIHYSGIIPHLVNCIKDLYVEIHDLKEIIKEIQ
jgi:hypothetical protein